MPLFVRLAMLGVARLQQRNSNDFNFLFRDVQACLHHAYKGVTIDALSTVITLVPRIDLDDRDS
jgi:hypothetical protein